MNEDRADAHAEHPEEYERECLELIRSYYQSPENQEAMMTDAGRVFVEAHVEDSYPYTQLVVLYRYLNETSPRRIAFPVWSDEWVIELPDGRRRMSPLNVIDIITTNLDEPGDPAN